MGLGLNCIQYNFDNLTITKTGKTRSFGIYRNTVYKNIPHFARLQYSNELLLFTLNNEFCS